MITVVFGFEDSMAAAERLGVLLELPTFQVETRRFPDRECLVRMPAPARTAILYRSLNDPDGKIVELLLAASAARDRGAERVILVAPYLAYMRQDRAFHPGEAVSQRVIGRLIADHFDALLTVDPHLHRIADLSEAVPGIPAISLSAAPLLASLIDRAGHPVIIGPDDESRQWTQSIAAPLGLDMLVASKERSGDRDVSLTLPEADRVRGRPAILVDDIISSGRTLIEAARLLRAAGALSVEALVTHCLATAADLALMRAEGMERISSTDSVNGPTNKACLAPRLSQALQEHGLI
ncbi:ribose-phosphate diphosphokinase (plasmid) [Sphingobium sp. SJ10-10]|uniref:ribose-phosphate diphosphokinase n=1 Tax=Sphingobium sp. SJ10-10 TaxID=3114999 RepID=UPI002E170C74|nr:ribose-phosphate diphosphokinase [Sphingobium sp. SJ10-10]